MSAIKLVISVWIIVISFSFLVNSVYASNTSALNFDGSNDYVEADSVNTAMVSSSTFSWGGWFRPTTTTSVGKGLGGFYTSTGVNNNLLF